MKIAHWIILGLTFIFSIWFVYRSRDTEPRKESSLDLNWHFLLGDPEGASSPHFDDSQWRYVTFPHDWMIEQPVRGRADKTKADRAMRGLSSLFVQDWIDDAPGSLERYGLDPNGALYKMFNECTSWKKWVRKMTRLHENKADLKKLKEVRERALSS